jgi:site-specific DNA-methyltransferase (adenine-specific)
MSKIELMQGDCLEQMKKIESGSVDMILADPPYGTTACKWDSVIPLEPMWEQLKRVIKPNGAIVMTASQPFTTTLIASNMKMFKYCWVYQKPQGVDPFMAKKRPLNNVEDVVVFAAKQPTYNPQKTAGKPYKVVRDKEPRLHELTGQVMKQTETVNNGDRLPTRIITFNQERGLHPTQKPVALMEYLIKTYTNSGDTVLDFTMGSGTTGVACVNLGRNFIGIELDDTYFKIARNRINEALESPFLGYFASGNGS